MSLPPVIFVLVQAKAAADGGISSISQVIGGLRDHSPIIVTDRETPRIDDWRSDGIEVHVLPQSASGGFSRSPTGMLASYGRYFLELRKIIQRTGAKLIHANDPMAFQLALAAAKATGTKIALNLRDTIDPARRPPRTRYRIVFGSADHVFFLSQDMADRWADVAANAKRAYSVTYSIVDPERFAPEPHSPANGPPVVLLSGIIRRKKGQLGFLRDVAPLLAENGIATWLAGDFDADGDEYMRACAEAAAPLGEMVKFLGYRPDIPQLIARSSVVAVASRHEGLVRAMIEAMSCARPVVSFDVCSAREVLEQQSGGAGIVVERGNHSAMADAILRYCREPHLATTAGEKGRSTAARLFAPDTVVRRYETVYDRLRGER